MNQESYSENIKRKKSNKEISIPIFIPLSIIIFFIILLPKIYNSNSAVITSSNEEVNSNISNEVMEDGIENNTGISEEKENVDTKTAIYTDSDGKHYEIIATLNIPSLGIEYPILSTTSTELLKIALNKYWGANPNEVGNMVVVGHNYRNSKFFSKLPNIEIGEIVKITDLTGKTLDYKVYDTYVVDPYDNACTSQLTDGHTEITLITCYYENGSTHATKRFVAKAKAN